IAAGQYLTILRAAYAPTWEQWETILKVKVQLSTGRASELMQIADGRKSLQEVRDATAERVRALRATQKHLRYSNEEESPDAHPVLVPAPSNSDTTCPITGQKLLPLRWRLLIDALAQSDASIRMAIAEALISGARQSDFEAVIKAVSDLY